MFTHPDPDYIPAYPQYMTMCVSCLTSNPHRPHPVLSLLYSHFIYLYYIFVIYIYIYVCVYTYTCTYIYTLNIHIYIIYISFSISRYEVTDEFSHRVTASVGERPMAVLVHLCLGLVDGRLGTAPGHQVISVMQQEAIDGRYLPLF